MRWPDFHATFINYWREALLEKLPQHYDARLEERVYLPLALSYETRETYIQILHLPDEELVAVLELLSPSNKRDPDRGVYIEKRDSLFKRNVHLVELGLLLSAQRLPMARPLPGGHFFSFVSRAERRPNCDVYVWTIQQPLPAIPIPLKAPDEDIRVDLGAVFNTAYDRGGYARSLKYQAISELPLANDDRQWARDFLKPT